METRPAHRRLFGGYLCLSMAAALAHGLLPPDMRIVSFFIIGAGTVPAMCRSYRRCPPPGKPAVQFLIAGMSVLSLGNLCSAIGAFGPAGFVTAAEPVITVGHLALLASALRFVRLRGRNDTGGLLDVAVVSMAGGGLLWTAALQPRLADLGTPVAIQAGLLFNVLMLVGVLGALLRLAQAAGEPILALRFVVTALVLALGGNITLVVLSGSLSTGRPAPVEVVFLVSYTLIGATGLHPSLYLLATPGPARVDRLEPGRLAFLGAALAVSPVAGAGRQLLGMPVDGMLLATSVLITVPLVMIRIGYLASQRVQAEEKLVHQATHDALTGLTNRAELLNRLDAALARRAAGGRQEVLLLFCDLDGFKAVNDLFGHAVGDELLVSVARRLHRTVARDDTLARYGGDEFLILCETTNPSGAQTSVSRRVSTVLADPFDLAGDRITIGVTIGAVVAGEDDTADSLISRADADMYAAKQRRRMPRLRSA